MSVYHVHTSIEGLLKNQDDQFLEDFFGMDAEEVRKELKTLSDKGHKLLRSEGCKHFDPYEKGCQCRFHEEEKKTSHG